ncbi:gamma-glutamylcyclotransferase [Acidovorax sp. NCPPB 4044]|uniref:gamma-glutamylcyclotransferase n=1 Tax=Acidovorax sp. NCPPB 4044 TaxID=2940490 RepID=UPI00230207D5|nr:gamma-glutamylcyclotransferase [Acidovorax sp. NCPPB 4044]MDA8523558.1 gamma-glutamylcyclotransferase [Acidovorax sp. NCPPB 4044]
MVFPNRIGSPPSPTSPRLPALEAVPPQTAAQCSAAAPEGPDVPRHPSPARGHAQPGRPRTARLPAVGGTLAQAARPAISDAAWKRMAALPPEQRQRLNAKERETVAQAVNELRRHVEASGIDFVPVFGFWSLRTNNHQELGKASQAEVIEGRDTQPARALDYRMDYVASTEYRGRPQHPGAVASIAPSEGGQVPGTLLKLPFDRAEELLTVLLAREVGAEADLRSPPDAEGAPRSSLMYRPVVRPVQMDDGSTLHALLFETNPESAKSLSKVFGDDEGLTAERLAFFIASSEGGFERDGKKLGGPSADYWKAGMQRLAETGDAPDPLLAQAYRIATGSRAPDGRLALDAMVGAAVPRGTWHGQKGWLALTEGRLPAVYAQPAGAVALAQHRQHQQALDGVLTAWRSGDVARAARAQGGDVRAALAQAVPRLLQESGFDPAVYAASALGASGHGRHLLHSESDARSDLQGLCALQVVAFDPARHPAVLPHPEACAVFEVPRPAGDGTAAQGGPVTVAVFLHRGIDGVSGGLERPRGDPFAPGRVLH